MFTIDLLTGKPLLLTTTISGGTSSSGSTYQQENVYADLPAPSSVSGQIYVVRSSTGTFLPNRKSSGFYFSNGSTWSNLGETVEYFKSTNFQVYDSVDNTKGLKFVTSGITTNNFRNITIQNSSGIMAYLSDVNLKLDISLFNTFTGTTLPNNYYNKTQINSYTGKTNIILNQKANLSGATFIGNITALNLSGTNTGDQYLSVGHYGTVAPSFINNWDRTVTIEPTQALLRSDSNHLTPIKLYNVPEATLTLVDEGTSNLIYIIYTGGTAQYWVSTDINTQSGSDKILLYVMWLQDLEVHSVPQEGIGLGLVNKINNRIINTEPYKLTSQGGFVISEVSTPSARTITVSGAIVYKGTVPEVVNDYNSSTDRLTKVIKESTGYTYSTGSTVYDNLNYNPYTGGETSLGNNKWGYRLYFRSIGDINEVFYMESPNYYQSEEEARLASVIGRMDLPQLLLLHCLPVGRSIIKFEASSGITEQFKQSSGYYISPTPNHYDLPSISLIWNNSNHKSIGSGEFIAGFTTGNTPTQFLKSQFLTITGKTITIPSTVNNIIGSTGITSTMLNKTIIKIQGSVSGNTIITKLPNIVAGEDGQIIILKGCSNTNLVTLQSETNLTGSKLKLDNGINFTLGLGDNIELYYDTTDGYWYEISRKKNS